MEIYRNKSSEITLTILGDNEVGKSTICSQWCKNKYIDNYTTTIGVDFYSKNFKYPGMELKLLIWDTTGEEKEYKILPWKVYANTAVFLIILSYDIPDSLTSLTSYINYIREKTKRCFKDWSVFIIINKSDKKDKKFTREDVEVLIRNDYPNVNFCEWSAKNNKMVNCLFDKICRKILGLIPNDSAFNWDFTSNSWMIIKKKSKCEPCC